MCLLAGSRQRLLPCACTTHHPDLHVLLVCIPSSLHLDMSPSQSQEKEKGKGKVAGFRPIEVSRDTY